MMTIKTASLRLFLVCVPMFWIASCAMMTPSLPPRPPKYVYPAEQVPAPSSASANSLWRSDVNLFEDARARRVNDLVTIHVVENITASGKADTSVGKKSSIDAGVDTLFGLPVNSMSLNKNRYTLSPSIKAGIEDDFKGNGATNREGKLVGTITAKVVEVMPNSNMVLESRKEITINHEKQILIFRGMVRPNDIEIDNTVMSTRLTDAEVYYVGDGIIQNKQRQGWLLRALDTIWPF